MDVERSRIALLAGLVTLCLPGGRRARAWADTAPKITVYMNPT